MNLKHLKFLSLILFAGGLVLTACQDSFDEEDFLNKQYSLDTAQQAKQVAALNESGKLLSFTVQVLEDENPVTDVAVTISNASGTGTTTVNTNATGVALFPNVAIGGNTVLISKTGYISASVAVDFGNPAVNANWIIVNNRVVPVKRNASLQLPIIAKAASAAGSTAVIKGKVSIETDVTNTTSESVPAGTIIRANFNAALTIVAAGALTAPGVANYFFTENTLGTATVAADGTYSMLVPATSDGAAIALDIPTIDGKLRVATNTVDGIDTDNVGPEFREVDAQWGPGIAYDAVPTVAGARAVFTPAAPSAPGRGFGVAFVATPRSLDGGTINSATTTLGNTVYSLSRRGSGYTASPTVDITGITGTDDAETTLRGFVTSVTVNSGGTGYGASIPVRLHLVYTDLGGDNQMGVFVNATTTAGGAIPTGPIAIPNAVGFAGNATPFTTGQDVQSFKVVVTDAGNTPIIPTTNASIDMPRVTELNSVIINNVGSGFSAAPTLTLVGGGATTQAEVTVPVFKTQFDLTLGTAATTPYKILPAGINFIWPATATENSIVENALVDRLTPIGFLQDNGVTLLSTLRPDGLAAGNLVANQPNTSLRTDRFWTAQPSNVNVADATITEALANVTVNNDGTLNTFNITQNGGGYDAPITVAIVPLSSTAIASSTVVTASAPGSGASVQVTSIQNAGTRAYAMTGASAILARGAGYVPNANRKAQENFTGTTALTVKVGNTYNVDIRYGTGDVRVNVQ